MRTKMLFMAAIIVLLILALILSGESDLWFIGPVLWFIVLWLFGVAFTEYATGDHEA